MNIILFQADEVEKPLLREDARAQHILEVLRRKVGESVDVGVINGPRGKAIVTAVRESVVKLEFVWGGEEPCLYPIDLIVGLSRPQTNRKILSEATSMGARSIRFVATDRGEPSYARSKLWTTGEWERHVLAGVEQAFTTRVPDVQFGMSLEDAIAGTAANARRICLDNYEAIEGLANAVAEARSITLALGSERGWTVRERDVFRETGFTLAHLGQRPLRTETATVAALGVACSVLEK